MTETICVKKKCLKNGFPCPHSKVKEILRSVALSISCKNTKMPSLHFFRLDRNENKLNINSKEKELMPQKISFSSGSSSESCCRNETNFLSVLGESCPTNVRELNSLAYSCKFTHFFREFPCKHGSQDLVRYCTILDGQCVLREFIKVHCNKNKASTICDIDEFKCI